MEGGWTEDTQVGIYANAKQTDAKYKRKVGLGYEQEDAEASSSVKEPEIVAAHYNLRPDTHRTLTTASATLQLKNFNNWIKSVLIAEYTRQGDTVFDLACGKGGDLLKWQKQGISRYFGSDIAIESVKDAVHRYNGVGGGWNRARMSFQAHFICADFTKKRIMEALQGHFRLREEVDVVSCQFAWHYSFINQPAAEACFQNASCCLRQGGRLIMTLPDANVLVKKLRHAEGFCFGNKVYQVAFDETDAIKSKAFRPGCAFGIRYTFRLEDAIDDCPEYLVHLPTLEELGAKFGLRVVRATGFHQVWKEFYDHHRYKALIDRMRVLNADGTISEDEWEAAYLYMAIVFEKVSVPGSESVVVRSKFEPQELRQDDILNLL